MTNLLHFLLQTGPLDDEVSVSPLLLAIMPAEIREAHPSPRIVSTHMHPGLIPRDTFINKRKVIMACRNPKDVAVSLFHHLSKDNTIGDSLNISWNCFVENWMKGLSRCK